MLEKLLLLDKDDTIYNVRGCFPNLEPFLQQQITSGRKNIVVTRATSLEAVKKQLGETISGLMSEIFAGDLLSSENPPPYYFDPNGRLRKYKDDYRQQYISFERWDEIDAILKKKGMKASDLEIENELYCPPDAEIAAIYEEVKANGRWVSRIDGSPRGKINFYKNPHFPDGTTKDLHLLRLLLAEKGYDYAYEAVMIGNTSDIVAPLTEPKTPLIVVGGPAWLTRKRIQTALDHLFDLKESKTVAENFDAMFECGTEKNMDKSRLQQYHDGRATAKEVSLDGERFVATFYEESGIRIIEEAPPE